MEGELKAHLDEPIGVFSFAAMKKTFDDRISTASNHKFDPIASDTLHVELLANANLFAYNSTTMHRCIVRNHSVVYGWCEELQGGGGSWTRTLIAIYQPLMTAEQAIAAVANNVISAACVKTYTQVSYVAGREHGHDPSHRMGRSRTTTTVNESSAINREVANPRDIEPMIVKCGPVGCTSKNVTKDACSASICSVKSDVRK